MTFEEIDWRVWQARDQATLVFIIKDKRILLIRKKRGLGAGKITGPGGRLEPGENGEGCARREVEEELRIIPTGLRSCGRLSFQFTDGYSIHVEVFSADDFHGQPRETEEAKPHWFPIHAIPYTEMWCDDVLWMPHLLAGRPFVGRFLFEGEKMLGHDLQIS